MLSNNKWEFYLGSLSTSDQNIKTVRLFQTQRALLWILNLQCSITFQNVFILNFNIVTKTIIVLKTLFLYIEESFKSNIRKRFPIKRNTALNYKLFTPAFAPKALVKFRIGIPSHVLSTQHQDLTPLRDFPRSPSLEATLTLYYKTVVLYTCKE